MKKIIAFLFIAQAFALSPGRAQTGVGTFYNIDNVVYVDGVKYTCSGSGVASALAAALTGAGGIVDARGCQGSNLVGGAWNIGSAAIPETLLLGPSTWAMGSNTITLGVGSKILGNSMNNTILNWTADVNGIANLPDFEGGSIEIGNVTVNNPNLASSTHAVINLTDCVFCIVHDFQITLDSTAASAALRLQAANSSGGLGTWANRIYNGVISRTNSGKCCSPATGIDLLGNPNVSPYYTHRNWFSQIWVESMTVGQNIFLGSSNVMDLMWYFGNETGLKISGVLPPSVSNPASLDNHITNSFFQSNTPYNLNAGTYYTTITGVTNALGIDTSQGAIIQLSNDTLGGAIWSFGSMNLQTSGSLKIGDQGTCTMSSGSCGGVKLSHSYSTPPTCLLSWTGAGTLSGALVVSSTHTTVTPASSVRTDSATVNWVCFGN
jgi:hypothetical protein